MSGNESGNNSSASMAQVSSQVTSPRTVAEVRASTPPQNAASSTSLLLNIPDQLHTVTDDLLTLFDAASDTLLSDDPTFAKSSPSTGGGLTAPTTSTTPTSFKTAASFKGLYQTRIVSSPPSIPQSRQSGDKASGRDVTVHARSKSPLTVSEKSPMPKPQQQTTLLQLPGVKYQAPWAVAADSTDVSLSSATSSASFSSATSNIGGGVVIGGDFSFLRHKVPESVFQEQARDFNRMIIQERKQRMRLVSSSFSTTLDLTLTQDEDLEKMADEVGCVLLDGTALSTWKYPSNSVSLQPRDYQLAITRTSLLHNTLVVLPTGLGKTLIAATVMLNFRRWYPKGIVVFLAPTRPLVLQQVRACLSITALPPSEAIVLTGASYATAKRGPLWESRNVIFATPQTVLSDLSRGTCPAERIVCVVVDEAHRATRRYAYTGVMNELRARGSRFRVVALSATPGNTLAAVQEVITNLGITHLEVRGDDDPQVKPYVHGRSIEVVVVENSPLLEYAKKLFLKLYVPLLNRMFSLKLFWETDPEKITWNAVQQARTRYRASVGGFGQRQGQGQGVPSSGDRGPRVPRYLAEGLFTLLIALFHAYKLLTRYGLSACYHFMVASFAPDGSGAATRSKLKSEMRSSAAFLELMLTLEKVLSTIRTLSAYRSHQHQDLLRHIASAPSPHNTVSVMSPKNSSLPTALPSVETSPPSRQLTTRGTADESELTPVILESLEATEFSWKDKDRRDNMGTVWIAEGETDSRKLQQIQEVVDRNLNCSAISHLLSQIQSQVQHALPASSGMVEDLPPVPRPWKPVLTVHPKMDVLLDVLRKHFQIDENGHPISPVKANSNQDKGSDDHQPHDDDTEDNDSEDDLLALDIFESKPRKRSAQQSSTSQQAEAKQRSSASEVSDKGGRVIIFARYRDAVADILTLLRPLTPVIRPVVFIGQSPPKEFGEGLSRTSAAAAKDMARLKEKEKRKKQKEREKAKKKRKKLAEKAKKAKMRLKALAKKKKHMRGKADDTEEDDDAELNGDDEEDGGEDEAVSEPESDEESDISDVMSELDEEIDEYGLNDIRHDHLSHLLLHQAASSMSSPTASSGEIPIPITSPNTKRMRQLQDRLHGMSQKEQEDVVRKFRAGVYNTLIATSIGEEGLDIGEVDLIVGFDTAASAIGLVQRCGRTGRKRSGRAVTLVSVGSEQRELQTNEQQAKWLFNALKSRSASGHMLKPGSDSNQNPVKLCSEAELSKHSPLPMGVRPTIQYFDPSELTNQITASSSSPSSSALTSAETRGIGEEQESSTREKPRKRSAADNRAEEREVDASTSSRDQRDGRPCTSGRRSLDAIAESFDDTTETDAVDLESHADEKPIKKAQRRRRTARSCASRFLEVEAELSGEDDDDETENDEADEEVDEDGNVRGFVVADSQVSDSCTQSQPASQGGTDEDDLVFKRKSLLQPSQDVLTGRHGAMLAGAMRALELELELGRRRKAPDSNHQLAEGVESDDEAPLSVRQRSKRLKTQEEKDRKRQERLLKETKRRRRVLDDDLDEASPDEDSKGIAKLREREDGESKQATPRSKNHRKDVLELLFTSSQSSSDNELVESTGDEDDDLSDFIVHNLSEATQESVDMATKADAMYHPRTGKPPDRATTSITVDATKLQSVARQRPPPQPALTITPSKSTGHILPCILTHGRELIQRPQLISALRNRHGIDVISTRIGLSSLSQRYKPNTQVQTLLPGLSLIAISLTTCGIITTVNLLSSRSSSTLLRLIADAVVAYEKVYVFTLPLEKQVVSDPLGVSLPPPNGPAPAVSSAALDVLTALQMEPAVYVISCSNEDECAAAISRAQSLSNPGSILKLHRSIAEESHEPGLRFLCSIPGFNLAMAAKLLAHHHGSVQGVIQSIVRPTGLSTISGSDSEPQSAEELLPGEFAANRLEIARCVLRRCKKSKN